jgi:D-amino-acid dehydrogenase
MRVIILGAGLIGVSSAYFLRKSGHEVTVIDRQPESGLETSFANGGQISVCYSEPWSSFSNLKKMIGWLGKEDSPILFRPHFNKQQFLWGLQFLYECFPHRNQQNIRDMLKIALYSRATLQDIREDEGLAYNQNTNGILTFYTSEDSYKNGIEAAKFMSKFGANRLIKTPEETLEIEPALKNSTLRIYGSDYSPEDESGDALLYTQQLTEICKKIGVKFLFGHEIVKLVAGDGANNKITSVLIKDLSNNSIHVPKADNFVIALGSYSYGVAQQLGIYLPIYPAKGYSATVPILDPEAINNVSLTDTDTKTVYTRLGNELRIAGTAEFNGYDLELNQKRCDALITRIKKIFPTGLDYENSTFWTGLRPATPGNVPIIEQTKKYSNLYINAGHGTLGWTMAAGSGKLVSQLINKEELFS